MSELAVGVFDVAFKMDLDSAFRQDATLMAMFQYGQVPELEVVHAMHRILRPGDTVIDGGASTGFFTCLMASLVGPKGRVIAYEPCRRAAERLRRNIEINSFSQVDVREQALWSGSETRRFYETVDTGESSLAKGAACDEYDVLTVRLNASGAKLVKLDLEGAECDVLMWMMDCPPYTICELNEEALDRFGHTQEGVRERVVELGYSCFQLFSDGSLPRLVPLATRIDTRGRKNVNVFFSTVEAVGKVWEMVDG